LLWAALAYAAGTTMSAHIWRPATWWIAVIVVFLASAAFLARGRPRCAQMLALSALLSLAILAAQLRIPTAAPYEFPLDDAEISVTGHVTAEGEVLPTPNGGARQTLEAETEEVSYEGVSKQIATGLRLNLFVPKTEDTALPVFHYGNRMRFPAKLRPPRNYHNPGAFDFVGYMAGKGLVASAAVRGDKVERLPGFTGNQFEFWRTRVHRGIIARIHKLWPPEQAALIDAMVIGDDAFIDQDTRADFQRSGTYHILVVSGMNVSILAFVTFWLLRRLWAGDVAASIMTMALAVLYAILTDVGAPVWRAVLMMAVYLGARLLYRERSMLNALGAAALALMLLDPQTVLGASFQLTFLCVLAIAAVGVPLLERTSAPYRSGLRHLDSLEYDPVLPPRVAQFRLDLRMVLGRMKRLFGHHAVPSRASQWMLLGGTGAILGAFDLIVISAVMQVSLALPMAYYFHRATSFGIPANMLVVPLTEILMPAAVAAVSLGYVSTWLARIPSILSSLALAAITGTVHGLGGLRAADLRVPTPEPWVQLATCLALAAAMLLARKRWQWTSFGLIALAASSLWIAWGPTHPHLRRNVLEVTAVDVGEGDSNLIVTPEGKTLLIDAGGPTGGPHISEFDIGENVVSPYLWSRGFKRLDVVALTHAHSDHMGGMGSVLKNFRPKALWLSVIPPSDDLQKLLAEARQLGIRVEQHFDGDEFPFGGMQIRVLAPARDWRSFRPGNNDSLVLKITYGETSALMEGDAEALSEARMVDRNPAAALLKVGHHGSKTSATPQFLAAVHPQYAVISVGTRNPFGLPKLDVLERLENRSVTTYRTDVDGAVTFFLDGHSVVPQAEEP
jgi:competence protein ComEC